MFSEQDQKQTDSIQLLQTQLENITKLMLNLTATVTQLQMEVNEPAPVLWPQIQFITKVWPCGLRSSARTENKVIEELRFS